MVLDLVVEPEVRVVGQVAARAIVHRSDHLPDVELAPRSRPVVEAEDVVAGVIGSDDEERVQVREDVCHEGVAPGREDRPGAERREEKRQRHEAHERIRCVAATEQEADRRSPLGVVRKMPMAPGAQRAGRIVGGTPRGGEEGEQSIAQRYRQRRSVDRLQVLLDQVGIARFPGMLVMQDVVLVDPRLGDHPVDPVDEPPPAAREHARRESRGDGRHLVVPAVADVVHEQPARRAPERERGGAERVRRDGRRGEPHGRRHPAPALDATEMTEVVGTERRVDLAPERFHTPREALEVDGVEIEGVGVAAAAQGLRTLGNCGLGWKPSRDRDVWAPSMAIATAPSQRAQGRLRAAL